MYVPSQEIGDPVPNNTEHAVSVTLPTWEAIVGYEEGDPQIVSKMQTGYPRFFIHKSILKLRDWLMSEYGRAGIEDLLIFSSYRVAQKCKKYMIARIEQSGSEYKGDIRIVKLYIPGDWGLYIGLVFFAAENYKFCKEFWQHAGEGISSRCAEYCMAQLTGAEIGKSNNFVEEKFGRNLSMKDADIANVGIRKRVAGSVESNNDKKVAENDVYLYPSGMASIYNMHHLCLETIGAEETYKTVVFGFPYVDTMNIASKFTPGGMYHCGLGSEEEIAQLEAKCKSGELKVLALITECPSNPLLKTPNLAKLRKLADQFNFPLIIDETVGNCLNINVYPFADMVCSSLTKIFSGDSNVLAGCAVLNAGSKFYPVFKKWMDANYENNLWREDCVFLERNSRDFLVRNEKTNLNAEKIIELFKQCEHISKIYYPTTSDSLHLYESIRNKTNSGYGGLISILFDTLERAKMFYNTIALSKGPSLGTNFTLLCPYSVLVHYNELDHVKQFGIHENLIRISVGIEDTDELVAVFKKAIQAAESV